MQQSHTCSRERPSRVSEGRWASWVVVRPRSRALDYGGTLTAGAPRLSPGWGDPVE